MGNAAATHGVDTANLSDWQRILMRRKWGMNRAGLAVPVPAGKPGPAIVGKAVMDMGAISPRVDMAAMSAWATITTPTPDRSEDIVEPSGVMLDSYRKTPVVLWDHGFGGISLPIGKSEDPDGNLALSITDEGIDACCYFAQGMYEACQIFELIVQKIIRATSIGFRPLEAEPRTKGLDRPGLHITLWELFEWSWVVVPDNPDAIAKVLNAGKLAGRAICEPILKSLSSFRPAKTPMGKGFKMPPVKTKANEEEKPDGEDTPPDGGGEGESGGEGAGAGETPAPGPNDAGPDDDNTKGEGETGGETETEGEDGGMKDLPLGAQVLTAAFAGLSSLAGALTASVGPLEHPDVKEFASGLSDQLNGMLSEVESTYGKTYPDGPKLKVAEQEDTGAKAVAKFLQQGSTSRMQLSGIGFRLKGLSASPRLKPAERDLLKGVTARIDRIVADARKSVGKPAGGGTKQADVPAEVVKALSEVVGVFKSAAKELKDAMPARAA